MISLFSEKYNRHKYLDFLKTYLLPDDFEIDIEDVTDQLSFKANKINQVTLLGNSETLDLAVFEMHHDSENDPRVTISRDAFKILASFNKNRAIVFFTSANLANYRLSLITIDLELDNKKTKKLFSNPRRYSYLLGNEAKLGTLFDKLVKAKQISGTAKIKDFADLVGRFAVEPVTKEFFNKYKELYDLVINEFEKSNNFKIVMSKTEGFNSDIFARKLLGQITFLYFLQKKRWLGGDPSNTNDWTDGRQDFLRWGFEKCQKEGYNYFDKFLEKLFYEGLNQVGDSFKFNDAFLKIPYLNGGLFECPYEYDETIIFAPNNELFSNDKNTGILDIFDQYNFTIDENTYFEQDIAIDPEMLGKVFENLLDDINRKGKGAFYTPREIVNYMTRESLKQFLITKLQDKENIEEKLDHLFEYKDLYLNKGDFANDEQEKEFEKQFNELYDIVEEVNKLLVNIKIADPAVGSGAFPMGILHEIVSIRSYIKDEFLNENANLYQLKKETIQKCIYGVDIDNGAIEIAKIRFWLSLVVDAEIPEALPNFDYKFMQGNSLIESFGDININQVRTKYSDLEKKDKEITNEIADINQQVEMIQKKFFAEFTETSVQNQDLLNQIKALEKEKKKLTSDKKKLATQLNKNSLLLEEDQIIDHLHFLQEKLYKENDKNKKVSLRNEIEDTIVKIFKTRIENDKEEYFQAYNQMISTANQLSTNEQREAYIQAESSQLKKKYKFDYMELEAQLHEFTKKDKIRPFFPWHLYFADVFKENGGFDIVIGNPPYVDIKQLPITDVKYFFNNFNTTQNRINLYAVFIEKGFHLINDKGILTYINPNSLLMNSSYTKLRKLILKSLNLIVKLPNSVFENAFVETIIILLNKFSQVKEVRGYVFNQEEVFDCNNLCYKAHDKSFWNEENKYKFNIFISPFQRSILSKIENNKSYLNNYAEFSLGITPYDKYKGHSKDMIDNKIFHSKLKKDKNFVPLISGKNIVKYLVKSEIDGYLNYGNWLGAPRQKKFFTSPRIIVRQIVSGKPPTIFAGYTKEELYHTQIGFVITQKQNSKLNLKYILALLNSKLMNFYHKYKFLDVEKETFQKILIENCKKFPIDDQISYHIIEKIIQYVDKIIFDKQDNNDTINTEIMLDIIVYKLYELTYDEAKIVDPEIKRVLSVFGLTPEQYEEMSLEELANLKTGVPQP